MKRSIEIHIGEKAQRVGTLHFNQDGNRENSAFEYASGWMADGNSIAIEPALFAKVWSEDYSTYY